MYWCGYLNSACNPIIYAFRSPSFRQGYLEILCRKNTEGRLGRFLQGRNPKSPLTTFLSLLHDETRFFELSLLTLEIDPTPHADVDLKGVCGGLKNTRITLYVDRFPVNHSLFGSKPDTIDERNHNACLLTS